MSDLVKPSDLETLPIEQRGVMITNALEESKSWLAVATKASDPTPIAEFKAWAATVAEMTRQKGLAAEIQLDAVEMVRRAERGIGLALRNGQDAGEIKRAERHGTRDEGSMSPLAAAQVRHSSALSTGIYPVTDGVTDEQFEEALTVAREEGDLSRANVVRKIHEVPDPLPVSRSAKAAKIRELVAQNDGCTSWDIGPELGITSARVRQIAREYEIDIPGDRVMRKTRHIRVDPERFITVAINGLQGVDGCLETLTADDYDLLDPARIPEWLDVLKQSSRSIRKLIKELDRVRHDRDNHDNH